MTKINRRLFIAYLSSAFATIKSNVANAREPGPKERPKLGAIRWDAWYSPDDDVGKAVQKSLSPKQFHDRMPFFGKEAGQDKVLIDGNRQEIVDEEIVRATAMGLDYWAYCWYEDGSSFRKAWELHRNSQIREKMNWCMIWQLSRLGGSAGFAACIDRFTNWMAEPNYQKVNGIPLVYLYLDSDEALEKYWNNSFMELRSSLSELSFRCQAAGLKGIYCVVANSDPDKAAAARVLIGASAISGYIGWVPRERPAPFSKLIEFNRAFWDRMKGTGSQIVPIVMTGWDTRPRKINPPPWENRHNSSNVPDLAEYVVPGTNDQITHAVRAAKKYVLDNIDACGSNTILIYSWNECDEGGGALVSKNFSSDFQSLR